MKARENLKNINTIVVKIGTSSLTYETGKLNLQRIDRLSIILSDLRKQGKKILLVTSGAIGVGAGKIGLKKRPDDVSDKQALAAIGQAELIKIYQKFFAVHDQIVAQVLLTKDGMIHEKRQQNAKNTINTLFDMGVIPIINENDTVAIEEIVFGDNDTLSAGVAVMIEAGLLILLSDIDGLYDKNPKNDPNAKLQSVVEQIDNHIKDCAEDDTGSSFATGGMSTKITAAKTCAMAGIDTVITNGQDPAVILDILNGEDIGTLFIAEKIKK